MLGDDLRIPTYIQTRPQHGYRFLETVELQAPVEVIPQPTSAGSQPLTLLSLIPSHMIGREHELALLHERFALALNGQYQVVLVTGEAGIGQTTLPDTFVTQVASKEPLGLAHW